jgi:hypothetical protein
MAAGGHFFLKKKPLYQLPGRLCFGHHNAKNSSQKETLILTCKALAHTCTQNLTRPVQAIIFSHFLGGKIQISQG